MVCAKWWRVRYRHIYTYMSSLSSASTSHTVYKFTTHSRHRGRVSATRCKCTVHSCQVGVCVLGVHNNGGSVQHFSESLLSWCTNHIVLECIHILTGFNQRPTRVKTTSNPVWILLLVVPPRIRRGGRGVRAGKGTPTPTRDIIHGEWIKTKWSHLTE